MFKSITALLFSIFLNFSLSLAGDLKLSMDTELGYIPRAASSEYLPSDEFKYSATDNAFVLSLAPTIEYPFRFRKIEDGFRIHNIEAFVLYGSIELTAFSAAPKEGVSFVPYRISYSNEIGVYHQFESFRLTAGWMHNCQHKVIIATYYDTQKKWNDFGYDNIFLRFHFSN